MPRREVEDHNRRQRAYFEGRVKRTMVPSESAYLERQVTRLVEAAGIAAGDRVLEVGCGMGRYTLLLAKRGVRVEGLDLSPVLLQRLTEYAGGRFEIPLHCVDLQDLEGTPGATFAAVVGFFVLHHVSDLDACFASVARLLRPGGRAAFVEPNPLNPLYYLQIALTPGMTWEGDRGILRMRESIVHGAMQRAGLRPELVRRFGFFPPFVTNRPLGRRVEDALHRLGPLRPFSAFQLWLATCP